MKKRKSSGLKGDAEQPTAQTDAMQPEKEVGANTRKTDRADKRPKAGNTSGGAIAVHDVDTGDPTGKARPSASTKRKTNRSDTDKRCSKKAGQSDRSASESRLPVVRKLQQSEHGERNVRAAFAKRAFVDQLLGKYGFKRSAFLGHLELVFRAGEAEDEEAEGKSDPYAGLAAQLRALQSEHADLLASKQFVLAQLGKLKSGIQPTITQSGAWSGRLNEASAQLLNRTTIHHTSTERLVASSRLQAESNRSTEANSKSDMHASGDGRPSNGQSRSIMDTQPTAKAAAKPDSDSTREGKAAIRSALPAALQFRKQADRWREDKHRRQAAAEQGQAVGGKDRDGTAESAEATSKMPLQRQKSSFDEPIAAPSRSKRRSKSGKPQQAVGQQGRQSSEAAHRTILSAAQRSLTASSFLAKQMAKSEQDTNAPTNRQDVSRIHRVSRSNRQEGTDAEQSGVSQRREDRRQRDTNADTGRSANVQDSIESLHRRIGSLRADDAAGEAGGQHAETGTTDERENVANRQRVESGTPGGTSGEASNRSADESSANERRSGVNAPRIDSRTASVKIGDVDDRPVDGRSANVRIGAGKDRQADNRPNAGTAEAPTFAAQRIPAARRTIGRPVYGAFPALIHPAKQELVKVRGVSRRAADNGSTRPAARQSELNKASGSVASSGIAQPKRTGRMERVLIANRQSNEAGSVRQLRAEAKRAFKPGSAADNRTESATIVGSRRSRTAGFPSAQERLMRAVNPQPASEPHDSVGSAEHGIRQASLVVAQRKSRQSEANDRIMDTSVARGTVSQPFKRQISRSDVQPDAFESRQTAHSAASSRSFPATGDTQNGTRTNAETGSGQRGQASVNSPSSWNSVTIPDTLSAESGNPFGLLHGSRDLSAMVLQRFAHAANPSLRVSRFDSADTGILRAFYGYFASNHEGIRFPQASRFANSLSERRSSAIPHERNSVDETLTSQRKTETARQKHPSSRMTNHAAASDTGFEPVQLPVQRQIAQPAGALVGGQASSTVLQPATTNIQLRQTASLQNQMLSSLPRTMGREALSHRFHTNGITGSSRSFNEQFFNNQPEHHLHAGLVRGKQIFTNRPTTAIGRGMKQESSLSDSGRSAISIQQLGMERTVQRRPAAEENAISLHRPLKSEPENGFIHTRLNLLSSSPIIRSVRAPEQPSHARSQRIAARTAIESPTEELVWQAERPARVSLRTGRESAAGRNANPNGIPDRSPSRTSPAGTLSAVQAFARAHLAWANGSEGLHAKRSGLKLPGGFTSASMAPVMIARQRERAAAGSSDLQEPQQDVAVRVIGRPIQKRNQESSRRTAAEAVLDKAQILLHPVIQAYGIGLEIAAVNKPKPASQFTAAAPALASRETGRQAQSPRPGSRAADQAEQSAVRQAKQPVRMLAAIKPGSTRHPSAELPMTAQRRSSPVQPSNGTFASSSSMLAPSVQLRRTAAHAVRPLEPGQATATHRSIAAAASLSPRRSLRFRAAEQPLALAAGATPLAARSAAAWTPHARPAEQVHRDPEAGEQPFDDWPEPSEAELTHKLPLGRSETAAAASGVMRMAVDDDEPLTLDLLRQRLPAEVFDRTGEPAAPATAPGIDMAQLESAMERLPQLDVGKIADKVYREIEKKLRFEAQRRGR